MTLREALARSIEIEGRPPCTQDDWLRRRLNCLPGELVRQLEPMKRANGARTIAKLADKRVLIFSGEHNAFWRPNGCGYVHARNGAGVFRFEDAWDRTNHCGPEKKIMFVEAR